MLRLKLNHVSKRGYWRPEVPGQRQPWCWPSSVRIFLLQHEYDWWWRGKFWKYELFGFLKISQYLCLVTIPTKRSSCSWKPWFWPVIQRWIKANWFLLKYHTTLRMSRHFGDFQSQRIGKRLGKPRRTCKYSKYNVRIYEIKITNNLPSQLTQNDDTTGFPINIIYLYSHIIYK